MSTPFLRDLAWRFVAGENLEAGLAAVRTLNAQGIAGTLNVIGTHVRDRAEAEAAAGRVIACVQAIRAEGLDAHLSLKLTQIGLDVDLDLARQQLARILDAAREAQVFVRVDMEESAYVDATLDLVEAALASHPGGVGVVLQSYLKRNPADLERMLGAGAGIRLVKGGYWESPEVALRSRPEVDRAFLADLETILVRGGALALASHDPAAIERAIEVAARAGRDPRSFEFQLLYGVKPELARSLVARGFRVRAYVPFGTHWYEYVLGCIRQDPAAALGPKGGLR
ncbi:proline dehydrogenase family protein [Mesoterricola sediminis]|uniref:proline dehydrogenase n=1 Tax=Mesoterricola sediminis TaxID=2927980 RepID=A0AA48GQT7_9BACT|nr:proline dehydrogenase family protein [Mesoterricola sediminis]BDU75909.1 proline dehydrogenase [Mesoterricola sediminis]